MADLDIAVQEDVSVRAADKLKHLYPEHGLWTLAVLQDAESLFVGQHWTTRKVEKKELVVSCPLRNIFYPKLDGSECTSAALLKHV